jgi:hypothetical protein
MRMRSQDTTRIHEEETRRQTRVYLLCCCTVADSAALSLVESPPVKANFDHLDAFHQQLFVLAL